MDIVHRKEEFNKFVCDTISKENTFLQVPQPQVKDIPKGNHDLMVFEDHEVNFNKKEEIDYNLEFLKRTPNENTNPVPKEEDNESVRIINKLKCSGAYKITDMTMKK